MAAVLAVCTSRGARLAVERLVVAVVVCETYGRARLLQGELVRSNNAAAEKHGAWAIVTPFRTAPRPFATAGASRLFAFCAVIARSASAHCTQVLYWSTRSSYNSSTTS